MLDSTMHCCFLRFNPQFIRHSTLRHNLSNYSNIPEFQNPSSRLIDEWKVYCEMDENFNINNEFSLILENYWKDKLHTLPVLSKITLIYIWVP
ncbi:30245_t:CDS:1, partial [Racocetra persica]